MRNSALTCCCARLQGALFSGQLLYMYLLRYCLFCTRQPRALCMWDFHVGSSSTTRHGAGCDSAASSRTAISTSPGVTKTWLRRTEGCVTSAVLGTQDHWQALVGSVPQEECCPFRQLGRAICCRHCQGPVVTGLAQVLQQHRARRRADHACPLSSISDTQLRLVALSVQLAAK